MHKTTTTRCETIRRGQGSGDGNRCLPPATAICARAPPGSRPRAVARSVVGSRYPSPRGFPRCRARSGLAHSRGRHLPVLSDEHAVRAEHPVPAAVENECLRDDLNDAQAFGEMIGVSGALRQIQEQIEQVVRTDASVLILGESGTGKELVAREIHRCSDRADRPMIRVNCASVPRELYESCETDRGQHRRVTALRLARERP